MDLASLQVSIKSVGAKEATQDLDKLRDSAKSLNATINLLNKKTGRSSTVYSGIKLIGEAARLAATHVKTLQSSLDSIGVAKLKDLATAANQLTTATGKYSKLVNGIKRDIEKTFQEEKKTAILQEKINTEKERGKKIATQTLAIQKSSEQSLKNSALITDAQANKIRASEVMATLKSKAGMAILDVRALNENAIGQKRLQSATTNATTSLIRQQTALKNHANATARAALAEKRLEKNLTSSNYHLKKHTQSWLQHWKSVASGIVLYQGIRSGLSLIVRGFKKAVGVVDDFQVSAIQLASVLTTMTKEGDPGENFVKWSKYSNELIPVLQKIDIRTSLNLQNLKDITLEMAKQGVVLDATDAKQVEGMTRIANAVALYSRNGQDVRQLQQEVRSVLQGQHRDTDQLGKLLYSILGDDLKPMLKTWQAQGVTIEKIGELLKGFGPANEEFEKTWSAAKASLETVFTIISREAFTPLLEEWTAMLKKFNQHLLDNKEQIADTIQNGWLKLKETTKFVIDNIWVGRLALEAFVGQKVVKGVLALNKALVITNMTLKAIGITAGVEMAVATGGLSIALGAIVLAIDAIIERWEIFTNAFKLAKLVFAGEVSLGDWITADAQDAQTLLDQHAIKMAIDKTKEWSGSNRIIEEDWQGSVGREVAPGIHTKTWVDEKTGLIRTGIQKRSKVTSAGKPPAVVGAQGDKVDTKTLDAQLQFNNARARALTLLESLDQKESAYASILDKASKSEQELVKLKIERQKFAKDGVVISDEEISKIEKLIVKNKEYELTKAAGGSKAIAQQLATDLEDYRKFYEDNYLLRAEYDQKVLESKIEANRKMAELDNSTTGIMKQALHEWSDTWTSTLNDMVWGAETSFSQILESFGRMVTQMIIQKQFVTPLVGALGFAEGGIMTSRGPVPLKTYATGGIANSPQVSLFGEGSMPEAYVPLPDGRTIPVTVQGSTNPQNIQVEIVNNSNEELKVESTQAREDPSGTVLSIVIDGYQRNKMGLRDMLSVKQ